MKLRLNCDVNVVLWEHRMRLCWHVDRTSRWSPSWKESSKTGFVSFFWGFNAQRVYIGD